MVCRISNGRSSRRRSITVIVLAVVVVVLAALVVLAYLLGPGASTMATSLFA